MKIKIKLTQDQIAQLVSAEKESLTIKFEKEKKELEKRFEKELTDLEKKYEYFEVNSEVEEKEKIVKKKMTEEDFIRLYNEGKTNVEIATEFGYTQGYISIYKAKLLKVKKIKVKK